jgi:peroxiredoxin
MADDLKPGDQAPAFDTVNDQGNAVKLADFKGKRVVLYFYPKDNTPGLLPQGQHARMHAAGLRLPRQLPRLRREERRDLRR